MAAADTPVAAALAATTFGNCGAAPDRRAAAAGGTDEIAGAPNGAGTPDAAGIPNAGGTTRPTLSAPTGPAPGSLGDRRRRTAGIVGVSLLAVMLIGLLAAIEVRLTTTTTDLSSVQQAIGGVGSSGRPRAGSILAQVDQLGSLSSQIAAMTAQIDHLRTDLGSLTSAGSTLAALPGIATELTLLSRQVNVLGGELSGVSSSVAPLGSIDSSLVALQAEVAALQHALAPNAPAG
ncbi:MAG: hypothetical protein M0Z63_05690 [Actinomycetota bacterium]|nr:hypothetical protein [Actinomycetota bacterium]MDA8279905.1 hypothetical protein [Actinomycetota bacterium]